MRGAGGRRRLGARTAVLVAVLSALPLVAPAGPPSLPGPLPLPTARSRLLAAASADEPSVAERLARFRAAARGTDHAARERAYDDLADLSDPRVVDAILFASGLHARERAALLAKIAKDEAADVEAAHDLERALRAYEKISTPTAAHYARYHEERTRLQELRASLASSLEGDRFRAERLGRLLDRARDATTRILSRVPDDAFDSALERMRAAWLRGAVASFDDRLRFLDAIAWLRRPGVLEALAGIVDDPIEDVRIRGAALRLRAERRDRGALEQAVALLAAPSWILEAAAVEALRLLHDRGSIEPLIAFLGREDLGRLREDARRALGSLTGEAIGPYREAWAAWWKDAQRDFELPRRPASVAPPGGADAMASFYGISTFSRRVLFVLDVSGSMAEPDRQARGGERKIDVARRELRGGARKPRRRGHLRRAPLPGGRRRGARRRRADRRRLAREGAGLRRRRRARGADERRRGARGGLPPRGRGRDRHGLLPDRRPRVDGRDPDLGGDPRGRHATRENDAGRHPRVGLGEHDPDLLRRIADTTGGRYVKR